MTARRQLIWLAVGVGLLTLALHLVNTGLVMQRTGACRQPAWLLADLPSSEPIVKREPVSHRLKCRTGTL